MSIDPKLRGSDKIVLVMETNGCVVDILDVRDIRSNAGLSTLITYGYREFTKKCNNMLEQTLRHIDTSQYSRITAVMYNRYGDNTTGFVERKQAHIIWSKHHSE
jgi:hypothetical protein